MVFDIGIKTQNDSNKFLRALCANFEETFGKCAWMYTPFKARKENRIFLGFMDIAKQENFRVYIHYKLRGCINKLEINRFDDQDINDDNKELFIKIISETLKSYKVPKLKTYRCNIESFLLFGKYISDFFELYPSKDNLTSVFLCVECYGNNDGRYIFQIKRKRFLDVLSVLTNLPLYESELVDFYNTEGDEIYFENDEYIDGYSICEERVQLTQYGKLFLEQVMRYSKEIEDENIEKILDASRHFHAGRKFDAQINDLLKINQTDSGEITIEERNITKVRNSVDNTFEMAVVSYISALEVLASIVYADEGKRCKNCGQITYSIASRVKKILLRYFNKNTALILHNFYTCRSKFLHVGKSLKKTYTGGTIPQLDKNSPSGIELHQDVPLTLLREYVAYCTRCVIREIILKDDKVTIYEQNSEEENKD